jgi:hypothetical protein
MNDMVTGIAVFSGMAFILIAIGSAILHFFVALNSRPATRAAWTVGLPYLGLSIFGSFGTEGAPFPFWVWPVAGLVPAGIVYWFWLRDFQKRWYDSVEDIPDGVPWANHDWKNGLLHLFALFVFALIAAVIRNATRG